MGGRSETAFPAFVAESVATRKPPSLPSLLRLRLGVKPPSLPSLLQQRRHFTHIRCCGETEGWVSEEDAFTAFIALSQAASEAAFIAFTAAAQKALHSPSLLLVPQGVMHIPAHSVRRTEWEGRRIACFHRTESC